MGWTFPYHTNTKKELIRDLTRDQSRDGRVSRILKKSVRGNVLYTLYEAGPEGDTRKFIVIFLMGKHGGDTWGYKDIDESMGPYEADCPVSYLDEADEPISDTAREWRETVRARAAKRKAKKPKKGETWTLVNCRIPEVKIVSVRPLRGTYNYTTYKLKRKLLGEKRNETPPAPVVPDMSTATITVYQPDGTVTTEEREPSNRPTLKELQAFVDGYIEPVDYNLPEGTVAYANEEGLLRGMKPNRKGTEAVKWHHPIVGPVVVLEGFDPEE
jgi:hypothetical protein